MNQKTPGRLRKVGLSGGLVCVGLVLGLLLQSLSSKLEMFDGRTRYDRLKRYVAVVSDVGFRQFSSSEDKVDSLHRSIVDPDARDDENLRKLVAAILLDGKSCNPHLLKYLESTEPLPEFVFYREFTNGLLNDSQISHVLEDEQGLMLWLLSRINHDRLVPPIDHCVFCEGPKAEYREFMINNWRFLFAAGDSPDDSDDS